MNYARYVDDILLIYDSQHTDLHSILHDFNSLHKNLHFTGETDHNNAISYLDITVHKTPSNIKISVYRKPTFTDTIIPFTSNHPTQHKFAAVRFLYNRLNTYQLLPAEYRQEENTIHNILHNSSFPILPQKINPIIPPHPQRKPTTQSWAVFTYTGKETTYITKLFKHTNIKIAYCIKNNLLRHLTPNPQSLDPFTHCPIQLSLPSRPQYTVRPPHQVCHTKPLSNIPEHIPPELPTPDTAPISGYHKRVSTLNTVFHFSNHTHQHTHTHTHFHNFRNISFSTPRQQRNHLSSCTATPTTRNLQQQNATTTPQRQCQPRGKRTTSTHSHATYVFEKPTFLHKMPAPHTGLPEENQ